MAIAYVAAASGYQNGGTTVTATLPAGASVGDVVLAFVALSESTIGDPGISGGGGSGTWTQVGTVVDDNSCRTKVWRRTVVTGDPGATITASWTNTGKGGLVLAVYSGVDTTSPIDASATEIETGSDGTHNAPGVTPGVADCWVVEYVAQRSAGCSTITAPGSPSRTERAEQLGNGGGTVAQIVADSAGTVTQGVASGSATYTFDQSTGNAVGWSLALTPASTGVSDDAARVTGTGTARAVTESRTHSIARATGSGTAQAVTAYQAWPVGRVTGAGTARAVSTTTQSGGVTMPELMVEVAFSTGADTGTLLQLDDPTRGRLDVGTLAGTEVDEPVWTDVTAWVRSGTIRRGAQRVDTPLVQYEAGNLSIVLDNSDRRFDPTNLSGPYVDSVNGTTQVTAMRAVRVRALWSNTYYELFRGFADAWDVDWMEPSYSECTLTATDAFKVLTGIDRPAVASVGGGERTGARIGRILDSAGWPEADRLIADGESTVQATTLEGNALAELQLVADTELGELYIDGAGKVVFRGRHDLLQEDRSSTSQATFGDGGGAELPYTDLEIATDDATFYNDVRVTRAGGTEQQVTDGASQALYYRRTYRPASEPILETDADALTYARWLLHVSADPELRFVTMQVTPRSAAVDLFPQVLGRQLGDRITVVRRPPGGGDPIDRDQFIRGVEHVFEPARWTTKWTLQDASKFGSFFVLDNPTLGRLDENALAY